MKKTITLDEYKLKYGIPIVDIAYGCGLSFHKVYNILRGGCPTLKTALIIQQYTNNEVSCEKLLPEKILEEIKKKKNEKQRQKK